MKFWASLMKVWGRWMAGDYATLLSELPRECPSPIELAGCHISWAPAEHRHESIAYRLDAGSGAFVYTGNTEYSESVVELARDADTLLIECAFPDDTPMPGHLTPSGVASIADRGRRKTRRPHAHLPCDRPARPRIRGQQRLRRRSNRRRRRPHAGYLM